MANQIIYQNHAAMILKNERLYWENNQRQANESIQLIKSGYFITQLAQINSETNIEIRTKNMIEYIIQLSRKYSDICLINDIEVKNCLISLGFTDKELIWLQNAQSLVDKINAINESGKYIILISPILKTLQMFLHIKIYSTVIDKYRLKDRKQKIPIMVKRLIALITNLERNISNRKKKGKSEITSDWELAMDSLKDNLKHAGITDLRACFKQMGSRNLDKLLIPIYYEYTFNVIPEKPKQGIRLSENEKLRTMYDLFCQMMPHREWASNLSDFMKSTKGGGKDLRLDF